MAFERSLSVRILNRVGAALRSLGLPLLSLDENALIARATRSTGLHDFGGDEFREGLRRLLDSLEGEAELSALGRMIARADVTRLLENRLRITDTLRRSPQIEEGEIRRPIFIIGLPRTGTTILHELMALDPDNRVLMSWEAMCPWPPPERATYESDPRIAEVDEHLAGVDKIIPGFKQMHRMGARLPQECVVLTSHDFAAVLFHTTYNVRGYQAWLDTIDMGPVYASHKRQLQYLQWRCPADRWVLKSPAHLWSLDTLLDTYPDARIVQTHRDPLKVIASLTSLVSLLRSMASDSIDPAQIATDWTELLADGLGQAMEARERREIPAERIFDMHFSEFIGAEVDMVRRIYHHFGLDLGAEAEARMRDYVSGNPRDKHGAHTYSLAETGLDVEAERRRYAAYQDRFDITLEPLEGKGAQNL